MKFRQKDGKTQKLVFCKSIKKNGKRIYHPKGRVFAFWVDVA